LGSLFLREASFTALQAVSEQMQGRNCFKSLPQNLGMHVIYLQHHSKVRQLYCLDQIELTTEVRQIGSYKKGTTLNITLELLIMFPLPLPSTVVSLVPCKSETVFESISSKSGFPPNFPISSSALEINSNRSNYLNFCSVTEFT